MGTPASGYNYCYLHAAYPDLFAPDYIFNAVQYLLGMHPGRNQAAFVTGVGAETMKAAYGVNRADWSYIPGGVSPGTNLIRPTCPNYFISRSYGRKVNTVWADMLRGLCIWYWHLRKY